MAPDSSANNKGSDGDQGLLVPDGGDIEAGNGGRRGQLYPGMMEDPRMRWAFIRKVYVLLCLQLFITVGVASTIFFVHPIKAFMKSSPGGLITLVSSFLGSIICKYSSFFPFFLDTSFFLDFMTSILRV